MVWFFDRRTALAVTSLVLACAPAPAPPPKSEPPPVMPPPAAVPEPPTAETGPYTWKPIPLLGGGFVTGIVWSTAEKDVAYARTDIGGAYRLDRASGTWVPLLDHFGRKDVNYMGVESIATDPTDAARVYLAVGTYTQEWAGEGAILRSSDRGQSFELTPMPVKMGGNEDGRSNGERLAVDPNAPEVLYFGSRRGGLFRSADRAQTFAKVESFPIQGDEKGLGLPFVVFDRASGERGKPTPVFYVGVSSTATHLYRTRNAGKTFEPVPNQPKGMMPSHAAFDWKGVLYLSYGNLPGPSNVTTGAVFKYEPKRGAFTDITPLRPTKDQKFGYGGLAVNARAPGTVMVTTLDRWTPPDEIFRTTDGGKHWKALGEKAVRDPAGAAYLFFGQPKPSSTGWMGHIAIDPFDSKRAMYVTGQGHLGLGRRDGSRLRQPDALELSKPRSRGNGGARAREPAVRRVAPERRRRHLRLPPRRPCGDAEGCVGKSHLRERPRHRFRGTEALARRASGHAPLRSAAEARARGVFDRRRHDVHTVRERARKEPGSRRDRAFLPTARASCGRLAARRCRSRAIAGRLGSRRTGCRRRPSRPSSGRASVRIAADRVNPKKFYAYDASAGVAYRSDDGGASFVTTEKNFPTAPDYKLGSASIRTVPEHEGDLWLTTSAALLRSTDSGTTFTRVVAVDDVQSVGFGKALPGRSYPTVYVIARVGRVNGFFRSDDAGRSFVRINDDRHQYGGGLIILGDPRVSGRVYLGTHGRGILYGEPGK